MQYYSLHPPYFAGDCIPFFHGGIFHLFYLRDENHHHALGGLGGHQWEHASSSDLIHWLHHPLALAIDYEWEKSICTGSLFFHRNTFYAFYSTRVDGWNEKLCMATSQDGIHFVKSTGNPFLLPGDQYDPRQFRDPVVFTDAKGQFHLLVTARLIAANAYGRGGCLAHLVSPDLDTWEWREPFIIPGYVGVPECPDYFLWHGWYYLVFSIDGVAHYRMSTQPFGPWQTPRVDTLDGPMARVMKTAAFRDDRRIGVAFLTSVMDGRDDGEWLYAGNIVFRELVQFNDGTLGARFVPEMIPTGRELTPTPIPLTPEALVQGQEVTLSATQSYEEVMVTDLPHNFTFAADAVPLQPTELWGLAVRGTSEYMQRYEVKVLPHERRIDIRRPGWNVFEERGGHTLHGTDEMHDSVGIMVIAQDDIIDVCIDNKRTIISRLPELRGDRLYLFCQNGAVHIKGMHIQELPGA